MARKSSFNPDIFDAVELGDLESVKMYWTIHTDIDYQDLKGMTLLMYAVSYDSIEITKYLLSKKPNLDLQDHLGNTVFDKAKSAGVLKLLEGERA